MIPKLTRTALAYTAGIITALAGLIVLSGWQFDSNALKTFGFGGVTMKVNTAISFLFSGLALFFLQNESRRLNIILARLFAAATFLLGLAVLSQYIFGINLGIDEFLFHDAPDAKGTINPGRMAPNTSLNFVLLGMVLFAVSFKKMERNQPILFLFVSAFTISLIGLLGYLFGLTELTGLAAYTKMAISTSLVFVVLSVGIYFTMFSSKRAKATLEYKLLSGLTIASVVILFGAVISLASIQSLVSASDKVEHTLLVKQELGNISREINELIAADRAYLLSGNENFIQTWKQSKDNIPKLIGNIESLAIDNVVQQNELTALKQLILERIDFSELLISTYQTKGKNVAETFFATFQGKRISNKIDEIISRMSSEEDRQRLERNEQVADNANNTITIIVLNLWFLVLLFVLLFVLVKKDITGRRKAEAALLKLNDELECRIGGRTADLVQAVEQIKKANRVYAVLSNVNQMIVREKDKQTLFDEACRIAVEDGKFRMAWIGMVDEQTNKVNPIASAGFTGEYLKTINIDLNDEILSKGPTGRVITSGLHQLANDIANNPEMVPWRERALKLGYKSIASFPIQVFGKTAGNFNLYSEEQFFFDEVEIRLLDELAMDISFAMEAFENEIKRNLAEEKLHEALERFNRLVSSLNDVIWTSSFDGSHLLDVNQSFENVYGITVEEFKANPKLWTEMVHPDDRAIAEASDKELYEKGKAEVEYRIVRPDGRIVWLSDTKSMLIDDTGNLIQMGGIARDITEQKNAEKLIITQRDLGIKINSITTLDDLYSISIAALHQATGMECGGIYLFDKEERNLDLNYSVGLSEQFCEVTSHYDEHSDHVKFVKTCNPVFIEYAQLPVKLGDIEKKENLQSFILLPLINKDKAVGCINLASRKHIEIPIQQQKGVETIAVLVANALERIRNEEEIRNMNASLEIKVEERTGQLAEANEKLQEEIEERVHAEEQLKNSEEKHRTLFETMVQGVIYQDSEGIAFDENSAAERILGLSLEQLQGRKSFDPRWKAIHEDGADFPGEDHPPMIALRTGKKVENVVMGIFNPKLNEHVWLNVNSTPQFRKGEEKPFRVYSTFEDITERRNAETEIKKAKLEAERANLAKSEFLSRMSHELRTPMNSILGFAQLMNMGELQPDHKKGVDHILKSGKHLLDLINEVLDLSRIEAGELTISLEPVPVHGIVSETMDVVKLLATEKNITFEFPESSDCDLFVKADRQKLKQVLLNLLSNAVKYNREGGSVTIKCSKLQVPNSRLNVAESKLETWNLKSETIRISITDTGNGIAPEYQERLFNPFERIGAEVSEVEGTGLGLAVSKKLIEAMNGTIGVESEPGIGSSFWIELLQSESQIDHHERKGSFIRPETESVVSGTLLYIEDNVSNIQLVEQILGMHRPQISLITEMYGKRTVQLATDYQPDLILLDLDLPDIHGSEVLKLLRANNVTKSIPVFILSADAVNSQIEKLMKAGAKNYLTKPIDVIEFLSKVDEVMKK